MKLYLKVLIGIFVIFVLLIVAGGIASLSTKTAKTTSPMITPHASSTPTPTPAPTIAPASYVEVDYQTVGWFYGASELSDLSYNYTYLVLNVTITNYGYSQVNVMGSIGFSVLINDNNYISLTSTPISLYNGSISSFYGMQSIFSFDSELPNPATLLNTGSVNGIVIFQFGSPTVYPQQPQILNEPFTLQYSVTYGNGFGAITGLGGPYATVVINQK
jgi:hypothetical protein